jgi:hypothetical protein
MRVLCINGDFSNAGERSKFLLSVPKELETYTIREVVERGPVKGYLLEEVFGGIMPSGLEVSFDSSRFVRLEEINTSEELIQEECLINFQ